MRTRLSTGIGFCDDMMNGGLPKGSVNLLRGPPGSGKSTICIHYVMDSIQNGVPAAYISLEETKTAFMENTRGFSFPTEDSMGCGMLYFEHMSCDELSHRLSVGLHDLENKMSKLGIERLVIDSVSPYLQMWESDHLRAAQTSKLLQRIRELGVTAILTCHSALDDGYGIDYLADSIITLSRDRNLTIQKMRGSAHSHEPVPYKITSDGVQGL